MSSISGVRTNQALVSGGGVPGRQQPGHAKGTPAAGRPAAGRRRGPARTALPEADQPPVHAVLWAWVRWISLHHCC